MHRYLQVTKLLCTGVAAVGYSDLGCWTDAESRDVPDHAHCIYEPDGGMSVDHCVDFCAAKVCYLL